jgi:zinc/manganese transport system permease protein
MTEASGLSGDLVTDVSQLFAYPFMVNAFLAGTIVALVAGLVGWFMVLRRQSFAGHTLAVVGFPGAAGATYVGLSPAFGFFGFCLAAALAIAAAGPRGAGAQRGRSQESAVIGTVQAFALACGFLFVSLYKGNLEGLSALLFGSFLGITTEQVLLLATAGLVTVAALGSIARPLLFASIDPEVAAASGVPVLGLNAIFLLLLGAAAAEASQITGSLLVFALLVVPAATAQLLTPRPSRSALLTLVIGLAITWLGLALAYYSSAPIGFFVTSLAFAAYLFASAARFLSDRLAGRQPRPGSGAGCVSDRSGASVTARQRWRS